MLGAHAILKDVAERQKNIQPEEISNEAIWIMSVTTVARIQKFVTLKLFKLLDVLT